MSLWDNWGDKRGYDEGHWHAHTRGLQWGLPEVSRTVQQVHCSRRRLLRRKTEFHVCTINKSAHSKKSLETYLMILVYTYMCGDFIVVSKEELCKLVRSANLLDNKIEKGQRHRNGSVYFYTFIFSIGRSISFRFFSWRFVLKKQFSFPEFRNAFIQERNHLRQINRDMSRHRVNGLALDSESQTVTRNWNS